MNVTGDSGSWLDRNWPLLLILFGVAFALILGSFKPTW